MNTATNLAWCICSKSRRIRRFVDSSSFQFIYKNSDDKQTAEELIVRQDLEVLRLWLYERSSFYDAPTRWLKEQAKKHRIPNYSRMTKVELVEKLTRINNVATDDDGTTISGDRG